MSPVPIEGIKWTRDTDPRSVLFIVLRYAFCSGRKTINTDDQAIASVQRVDQFSL